MRKHKGFYPGFTIIEILVVVVVIAILATIAIVAYRGIADQSRQSALMVDLSTVAKKLLTEKVDTGTFPTAKPSYAPGHLSYAGGGEIFCVSGQVGTTIYHVTQRTSPREGECPLDASMLLQTTTADNCPTARTMKIDVRDKHTYWVQKMADGKCWMLTNLAYAGGVSNGGANTYNDVAVALTHMSYPGNTLYGNAYTIRSGANPTTYPTVPALDNQYGYLYTWCAAMGVQSNTGACTYEDTPLPDAGISICPAGWRIPTGGPSGEMAALNNAVNNNLTTSDAGLRSVWMGQYAGYFYSGAFREEDTTGVYWSSTLRIQISSSGQPGRKVHNLKIKPDFVSVSDYISDYKYNSYSIRCVAK